MSKPLLFLIAAVLLFSFALQLILDRPQSSIKGQQNAATRADLRAKASEKSVKKSNQPAGSAQSETAGWPNFKLPKAPPGAYQAIDPENEKPEVSTTFGVTDVDDEDGDTQETEGQLIEDQVDETLSNPLYLFGESTASTGADDPEDLVEEEISDDPNEEFDDAEIEDDSEKIMNFSIEPEQDEDLPTEPGPMPEEEMIIKDDAFDSIHMEEKSLNAQIEESLRNPAYLQSIAEEEIIEETSEED
jgi:hypothetical protein